MTKLVKNDKNEQTLQIFTFLLSLLCHSGFFWVNQESVKISTNTYRTEPSLCELNALAYTLQFEYKFGTWQIKKNV